MTEIATGNQYDHSATLKFFARWWKLLTIVFVVALAASVVVSFLITPRFKSTATFIPSNSNRLTKAIMDYHYSMDFMDYGAERDCEHAIQILSSHSMEADVCQHFNLLEHYDISPDDPHKMFNLHEQYLSNITVKRTEYLGIDVTVMDEDPQMASDIANYIVANYDTVCRRMHHDRAADAARIMQDVCDGIGQELIILEDSLRRYPQQSETLRQLIEQKCSRLADVQTRATETRIDMGQNISYKFVLDEAVPSDKKAYPKRAIIVAVGAFGTLAVCILALLVLDAVKKEEETEA